MNKERSVSNNNLLLNLQTQCPLDISTRRNPFIFSSKIGENSFAMSSETTCPSQRQLTHHHFLPPYPSITLFSSDFSKPLNPPSSVSTAHTLSPVLGLLQSISSHQSFCLCLCPFQPHYMTVSKSVFPKHQWRFQNNPNKQFQRTFLSSGSTVGKGAWLLRQILGERPHTYPDVYEIVPQSVWYFTATSQVVRDADLHFLIHTRGASYSSSVYRGRFQPQGGWTYFSKSTGFVQVFSSTCLLWFCH